MTKPDLAKLRDDAALAVLPTCLEIKASVASVGDDYEERAVIQAYRIADLVLKIRGETIVATPRPFAGA